jgi:arylamine N-acetyltransferase
VSNQFERYLRLLGVECEPPSREALTRLVSAHLYHVPFENVSKLTYHRGPGMPTLERYLDGIERHRLGGTCYSNNFFLFQLLGYLGYRVRLCGADMNKPDVHLVSIVEVDHREYLVDVGYAAPFDRPIPRDIPADYQIAHLGRDRYLIKPQDANAYSQVMLIRDGQEKHGYRVNPAPRQIEEFNAVLEQSYRPTATFMNTLLLAQFSPNRSRVVHNMTAIEALGVEFSTQRFASRDFLAAYVEKHYGILRPMFLEALDILGTLEGDAWN